MEKINLGKSNHLKILDPKARCIELANKSTFRTKHGSVVVHNGIIIGSGFNINLTHDMTKTFNEFKTLHAEMIAILRVKNKRVLKDSSIFVTRVNQQGKLIMSKPCEICSRIIASFGIVSIFYTDAHGEWVEMLTKEC